MSSILALLIVAVLAFIGRNGKPSKYPKLPWMMTSKDWAEMKRKEEKEKEREFRKMMRDIK